MADFRALCAEGVAFIWSATDPDDLSINAHEWAEKVNAALAEPEPEEPTDEELCDLMYEFAISTGHGGRLDEIGFARAVLARWGHPAPTLQPRPVDAHPS